MTLRRRIVRKHWRFQKPFSNAQRSWEERESLELLLEDETGVGVGEAAPLPGYSPDTLEQAERALSEYPFDALPALIERDNVLEVLASLPVLEVPSARFALESAVLGWLAARRQSKPSELLLSARGAQSEARQGLPLAHLVEIADAEAQAERALASGYSTLKLKVGTALGFEHEVAALMRLRARFGSSLGLRVDANGSFPRQEALDRLRALAAVLPEFLEEPLPHEGERLTQTLVPIGWDESLTSPAALSKLGLERANVRVLVLKPTLLGGISRTLAFVERACSLGCAWVLSHAFEGDSGYRALCELALGLPQPELAHGLAPHAALGANPELFGVRGGKLWPESA